MLLKNKIKNKDLIIKLNEHKHLELKKNINVTLISLVSPMSQGLS